MTAALQRILFVEDDDDVRMVATLALEAVGGFTVVACASGELAVAAAPQARADLLLLDVMMPRMDGPATLRALRDLPATAATPAIFMTAKAQPQEVAQLKALGALDVITKPFEPMELADQLRAIWKREAR